MELVESLGQKAFNFEIIFSLVITFVGIGMLAGGVDPGAQVRAMFLPLSWIYGQVYNIQSSLPTQEVTVRTAASFVWGVLTGFVLEFLFMMLTGFLALVYSIASIIPPFLSFLVPPLYFLGAFLQLMVWVYGLNIIMNKIMSLIPGVG